MHDDPSKKRTEIWKKERSIYDMTFLGCFRLGFMIIIFT